MKVQVRSKFLKLNEDVKDQDLLVIKDEGKEEKGKFGLQMLITMETPNGEEKLVNLNNSSKKNLISEWGDDSSNWVNKEVRVHILKDIKDGKMTFKAFYTSPNKDLEGNVIIS